MLLTWRSIPYDAVDFLYQACSHVLVLHQQEQRPAQGCTASVAGAMLSMVCHWMVLAHGNILAG